MEILRRKRFMEAGADFEVRASADGDEIVVQVYKGEMPIGLRFRVTGEKLHDLRVVSGTDAVASLMGIAERDFVTRASYPRPDRLPEISIEADLAGADFLRRLDQAVEGSSNRGCSFHPRQELPPRAGHANVVRLPYDDNGLTVQVIDDGTQLMVEGRSWLFTHERPSRDEYVRQVREVLEPVLDLYAERFGSRPTLSVHG